MKEDFKLFVNEHPELINFVNKGDMTWQKFYDMFSLYGKNEEVWKEYFKSDTSKKETTITDIVEALKKVDVDTVQKNITTINKALALISTLFAKEEVDNSYTPRPLYKKFED